jgi:flagellar motor switch/type III secretory pathway protein FliN
VLGFDVQVSEIKPTLTLANSDWVSFRGDIEGCSIALSIDQKGADLLAQEVLPRVEFELCSTLVVDYLAQRFMGVLGMTQTILENAGGVAFAGRCAINTVPVVAAVRLSFSLNSNPCVVLVGLSQEIVDRMDRLWRRQLHSSIRGAAGGDTLRLEIAQLGVPPHLLSEYVTKGTVIDLEVPVSDGLVLRVGGRVFMPARMVDIDGMIGCQTVQGIAGNLTMPEGTSRLSIDLAAVPVDQAILSEMGQVGAVFNTGRRFSDKVTLTINQERVADAVLSVYQGRYAVEVV